MQQLMNGETEIAAHPASPSALAAIPPQTAETRPDVTVAPVRRGDGGSEIQRVNDDTILGRIALLFLRSPAHRLLFLQDLDWRVLPPLRLGQTRIFMQGGRPFAYASWAFLSPEVAARIAAGDPRLRPADWTSGDEPWLIDLVAPRGATEALIKLIEAKMLGGRTLRRRGLR